MWSKQEFLDYLQNEELGNNILMKMQEIIYLSVKSVQDQVEQRTRSFELFGYDFLID